MKRVPDLVGAAWTEGALNTLAGTAGKPDVASALRARDEQVSRIDAGIEHLKTARAYFRKANAPKAAAYVSRSIKSAEGARRNARARPLRETRKG